MGSYGLFETGLIKETLLWPNGDMTCYGPEPQTTNQLVDMNQKDMMDGYVVFHKKLGKSIPIYEISSRFLVQVSQ